jgi:carboxypeptidase family protein
MSNKPSRVGIFVWLVALLAAGLWSDSLMAQNTGTILGTVKDQSGAVLPGANITIKNVETGISRTAVSGSRGEYRVPALNVGTYEVQAEMQGFQTGVRQGITLTVGREAVIDFSLTVGNVTEQVTVTGEAPLIETTTASVSGLVDSKQIRDIPLNGRSFLDLVPLQTGAVINETGGQSVDFGFAKKLSVVGTRYNTNAFLLDGANINDASGSSGSAAGTMAGVETVREFRVITNAYDAEFGNHTGGVISAITKSGTNQLHGSLFEFLRNDNLDAARWEDNKNGNQRPNFERNQFGGTVGGPIKHDRTFFFGSYEGLREGLGQTTLYSVPGYGMRAGRLVTGSGANVTLAPPISVNAATLPYVLSYPVPNKTCRELNSDATKCVSDSAFPYDWSDGSARYIINRTRVTNEDLWTGRIDHQISNADSIFVRVTTDDSERRTPGLAASSISGTANRYITTEETHIFSPAILSRTNLSFIRTNFHALPQVDASYPFPKLTFGGQAISGGPAAFDGSQNVGSISITSPSLAGWGGTDPKIFILNTWQFKHDIFHTRGRHSLKYGGQFERVQFNQDSDFNAGGSYTFPTAQAFLLNQPSVFDVIRPGSDAVRGWRSNLLGLYVQDDISVRPGLTLNAGLRYEIVSVPVEVNGKMANVRNINPSYLATLTFDRTDVGSPYILNPSLKNFAPRLGFAWSPFKAGKTAVRGGVGVYYEEVQPGMYEVPGNRAAPFYSVGELLSSKLGTTPIDFPVAYFSQRTALLDPNSGGSPQIDGIEFISKQPTVYKWSFDVSQQLSKDSTFEVGYSGTRGLHLLRGNLQLNATPSSVIDGRRFILITQPLNAVNWGRVRWRLWDGTSIYHGLRASFNKRFGNGLQLQASYTFSKSIDDGSAYLGSGDFSQDRQPYGITKERALSAFDIRQSMYFNFTYDVPVPKGWSGVAGAALGGWSTSGVLRLNSGGPISIIAASPRVTLGGVQYNFTNVSGPSVDLVAGGKSNSVDARNADKYFDVGQYNYPLTCLSSPQTKAACAGLPVGAFQGNVGPNTVTGPGIAQLDFTLVKETKLSRLREGTTLQFRSEFFNILNRVNFDDPATNVFNNAGVLQPTAGQITGTRTTSRQIQFALRLLF